MSSVPQPFARMGAEMTGVDAVEKNIGVASVHAVYHWIPLRKVMSSFIKFMNTPIRKA